MRRGRGHGISGLGFDFVPSAFRISGSSALGRRLQILKVAVYLAFKACGGRGDHVLANSD